MALEEVNLWADVEENFEVVSVQAWNAVVTQVRLQRNRRLYGA